MRLIGAFNGIIGLFSLMLFVNDQKYGITVIPMKVFFFERGIETEINHDIGPNIQ